METSYAPPQLTVNQSIIQSINPSIYRWLEHSSASGKERVLPGEHPCGKGAKSVIKIKALMWYWPFWWGSFCCEFILDDIFVDISWPAFKIHLAVIACDCVNCVALWLVLTHRRNLYFPGLAQLRVFDPTLKRSYCEFAVGVKLEEFCQRQQWELWLLKSNKIKRKERSRILELLQVCNNSYFHISNLFVCVY